MVDLASSTRLAPGRSQRSKSRVDYTAQIYVGASSKKGTQPVATPKPWQRVSQESSSQANSEPDTKKSSSLKSLSVRGSKATSGKHKTVGGTALNDKSNAHAAAKTSADAAVHASPSHGEDDSARKRTRGGGTRQEQDPLNNINVFPACKRRKGKGDHAGSAGHNENVEPVKPHQTEAQVHNTHDQDASGVLLQYDEPPYLDQPFPVAHERVSKPKAVSTSTHNSQPGSSQYEPNAAHAADFAVDGADEGSDPKARDPAATSIQRNAADNRGDVRHDGRAWDNVNAIFLKQSRQTSTRLQFSQVNTRSLPGERTSVQVDSLEGLFEEGNQQLRCAAQEEIRVLTAENKQQAACLKRLQEELDHQKAMHHKHDEEVLKQVQRMKTNYQVLYERFQKHRTKDFEGAQNVLESVWEAMEERADMANQMIDSWKDEAEKQRTLARTSGLDAVNEELQAKQDEIISLKKKLLEEAESSLLQAQELANLRHLVACFKSLKPTMIDAAVMAQPEVMVSTTQTPSATQRFSLAGPVSRAKARRRAQALDVTCMARSLVPEGADVCSVDTHVLRAALLKPTELSHAVTEACNKPAQDGNPVTMGKAMMPATECPDQAPLQAGREGCACAVVEDASAMHAARFSSSARPPDASVAGAIDANIVPSNSERGSNAAVLHTPQLCERQSRDTKQPACSDPGPVREKSVYGGPHCIKVPVQRKQVQGVSGLLVPLSPAFPSNVAEVGDTQEPSLDNLLGGGPMSTSESEQRYGEADGCGSDGSPAADGDAVMVIDDSGSDGGCAPETVAQGAGTTTGQDEAGALAGHPVHADHWQDAPVRLSGMRRRSDGDVDSGRSTDMQDQMRVFRDKMLSMEVTQSPYGTAHKCRDLKSGFTFTIMPCVSSAPPIHVPGPHSIPEVADELTFVPHMNTCPEHVKALLPEVFQEEFDFRADHLHGLQKRIDRALEVVNGSL